jgi:hypothetical protein
VLAPMARNAACAVRSAIAGRSPLRKEIPPRRPGWRSGARSACAIAVVSSPLLGSLYGCDVSLSATASIGQSCTVDQDCPPGQRCIGPTANSGTCELALDAAALDSGDATVPSDGGLQSERDAAEAGDAGEPEASAPDGGDAGEPDAITPDGGDSGEPDGFTPDGGDSGEPDSSGCPSSFPPSTLILFGGMDTTNFGDTWLWDGASWSIVDAGDAAGPSPRSGAAMATACGYAVLVGGTGAVPSDGGSPIKGDAWLWNGSRWQPAPTAPAARFAGAAGTLGSTLYLFGGEGPRGVDPQESGLLAWDGGAWSTPPQSSPSGPPPRAYPVLVTTAGGLLVFGGLDTAGNVLSDTWLLTDSSWQLLDDGGTQSGPAFQAAGAASIVGAVVMFGGLDENFDTLGDTWLWDGGSWSRIPAEAGGPPARAYPAMGTLNGQVVMFGGLDENFDTLGDTWLWDGGSWVRGPDAGPSQRTGATITAY